MRCAGPRVVIALVAGLGAVVLPAAPACADAAAARKLFDEAKRLRDAGEWRAACRKFNASFDLDPSVGPLLNIAECFERERKLASALDALERAAVMARSLADAEHSQRVAAYTQEKIVALVPRVPTLSVNVTPRTNDLVVKRGSTALPLSALGEALPVDPGRIHVTASASGYQIAEQTIELAERDRKSLTLQLVAQDAAPGGEGGGTPAWVWGLGGAGIALGLAAGGFAIWYALVVEDLKDACHVSAAADLDDCMPDPGYDPADDNRKKNTAQWLGIGFGIGAGAALGAAIIGYIVSPGDDVALHVFPGGGSLHIRF